MKHSLPAAFVLIALPAFGLTIRQPGVSLVAESWDKVRVCNESGETMVTLTGLHLKGSLNLKASGGAVREVSIKGRPAIEVAYQLSPATSIKAAGTFIPGPDKVEVIYQVSGAPAGADLGGGMFGRKLAQGAEDLPFSKAGSWRRHAHGGQPVETPDGKLVRHRVCGKLLCFAFSPANKVNPSWKDAGSHHTFFTADPEKPGVFTSRFGITISPDWPDEAVSALWMERPVGLKLSSPRPFHWWESGSTPVTLSATVVNPARHPREVTLTHQVRDFTGTVVSAGNRVLTLAAGRVMNEDMRIVPRSDREILFAEVSVTDHKTGREVFARTNLTLLPPHAFKSTPADSPFGIAAFWPIPDEPAVKRVLDRMGVRWSRTGSTKQLKSITAIHHNQIPWKLATGPGRDVWIRRQFETCIAEGKPAWEFGNEINYQFMGIATGDVMKHEAREQRVKAYVRWLRDVRRVQKQMGPCAARVKLLSAGIAGMDVKFIESVHAAGGWELLDGLAIHPGRGNFAPDYPVTEPWANDPPEGAFWNYLGSVKKAKNLIARLGGDKELWLTEVYCPSFPNSHWGDSLRHGAENTLLSLALAKAENVKAVMWYQLFDSVWHDRLGVDPDEREYFFGLIQRDLSFKPALLAYCTAAEELDQARFVRWLRFPGASKTRGMLFDTPRGPMAVLWDRSDGYVLSRKVPNFASPEPWVDTWKTRLPTTLPVAAGQSPVVINAIGQRSNPPHEDEHTTLDLTGAPVIVYGLDPARLE